MKKTGFALAVWFLLSGPTLQAKWNYDNEPKDTRDRCAQTLCLAAAALFLGTHFFDCAIRSYRMLTQPQTASLELLLEKQAQENPRVPGSPLLPPVQ